MLTNLQEVKDFEPAKKTQTNVISAFLKAKEGAMKGGVWHK